MRYNPCGRYCEMMRRPYQIPCRFLKDSELRSTLVWVEAQEDALPLDRVSIIESEDWSNDRGMWPDRIGEQDGVRKFRAATAPVGSGRGHVCGTDEEFNEGGLYEPDLPPVEYDALGWPLCCSGPRRLRGGAGASGKSRVYHRKPLSYGGAGASGRAWIRPVTPVRSYGGAGASGRSTVTPRPPIRVYGGAGASGQSNPWPIETWERTESDVYLFVAEVTGPHQVELIGGGSGGTSNIDFGTYGGGGGGGGGAYSRATFDLVAGTTYRVAVGAGGLPFTDGHGSTFGPDVFTIWLLANSGTHGMLSNPGPGGAASIGIGIESWKGGDGASAFFVFNGGGGGGGAVYLFNGQNATGQIGGVPWVGGGGGGDGRPSVSSSDGTPPGGGGGGAHVLPSDPPGAGSDGLARISWGVPPP